MYKKIKGNNMAKIISFFNHKGGVGKTTTVHNLACALRKLEQKVLVIDADPQMNLTAKIYGFSTSMEYTEEVGSTWRDYNEKYTSLDKLIYNIFTNEAKTITIYKQEVLSKGCLHLIPSSFHLAQLEMDIVDIIKRNNQLDSGKIYAVERFFKEEIGKDYDFILIDFSPSASSIINALFMMMSDYFIVPTSPTIFCLQAIENLESVFKNWSQTLSNHKQTSTEKGLSFQPRFLGLIISLVKRRTIKGITNPTSGTKKWIELVNKRIKNFYAYAQDNDRTITKDEFKKIFLESEPFLIKYSYDFTLELRTKAEELGKSEFDLEENEIPNARLSKRKGLDGNDEYVQQYLETLKLLKETFEYIAKGLITLK